MNIRYCPVDKFIVCSHYRRFVQTASPDTEKLNKYVL